MKSPTYGEVSLKRTFKIIKEYIKSQPNEKYHITVGTDSQNFDVTKTVVVIAVWRVGKGGIFFYEVKKEKKINNLQQKIYYETSISLDIANKLTKALQKENLPYDVSIHVDIGRNGPTAKVIPEIVGWITSCGYKCEIKPNSYTASGIANKFTKHK
nr:MAG: hypothetical protein DIU64_11920 [Caldicoprobacter oshimai]